MGFSQQSNDIDYGVTLVNRGNADAAQVLVTVHAIDALGRSSATDQTPVSFIPAGGRFNLAGLITPTVALKVSRLRVTVRAYSTRPRGERLPQVRGIRFSANDFGSIATSGTLTNPTGQPLSADAPIYVVFLDRKGHIIDAAYDSTGASVRPHESAPFHLNAIVNDNTHPAAALVSVDACTYVQCTSTGLSMQVTTTSTS